MEAAALLKSAGEQLVKWMVEEAKYLDAVKDKIEGLHSELEWIQCFLRNTEKKKRNDELFRKWISEINNLSYEAEDILEKYLLKVSDDFRNKQGITTVHWGLVTWTFCCANNDVAAIHQVGSEIEALTCKISKLSTRMVTYGVKPGSNGEDSESPGSGSLLQSQLRRTHSYLPVDDIVGLKKDSKVLLEKLLNKETKVIAISGSAGFGKTTLARKVYQEVKGRQFNKCAWIYVSQKFDSKDIIKLILLELFADDQTERDNIRKAEHGLERKLYGVLQSKKCLLVVLDDLWKVGDWKYFEDAFPKPTHSRSKLLFTTRTKDLILHVDPQGYLLELERLKHSEGLELLKKKAFHGKDISTGDPETKQLLEEMEKLGDQMVKKCKGLPLAIVVLGGILALKKTKEDWGRVQKNVETYLTVSNDNDEHRVTNALELSYTDLPNQLRPCFLHLGNFPEGFEIPTKKLYRMWIAEGIVAPSDDYSVNLESVANSYLKELVNRCIVQVVKIGPAGKIKTCRLHDSMWEMCTSKAKEENFLSIVRQEKTNMKYINSIFKDRNLHRVAIHSGENQLNNISSRLYNASHLRSLMFFRSVPAHKDDQSWLKTVITDPKLLRVLFLETTGIDEVPKMLGSLIHLRYLSIKGTPVKKLSSSIGNLRCLQTLDLRVLPPENCVMRIPNVLWRMKRLKQLYLPTHAYKVKWFHYFQKLRTEGLICLEILKNFDTSRARVKDLLELEFLRKLSVKNVVSQTETLKTIMECKSIKNQNLEHLSLKIHDAILNAETDILSSCSCLHTLEMTGTNSAMTKGLMLEIVKFPENLKKLVIKSCKLICTDPMQIFKHLSNLRSLSLDQISFSGTSMDCTEGGFNELVDLKLSNIEILEKWMVEGGSMPKLHRLQIYDCKKLQMIPDRLPASVEVICKPCVKGTDKYFTCPYIEVALVDDDDEDLAARQCNKYLLS